MLEFIKRQWSRLLVWLGLRPRPFVIRDNFFSDDVQLTLSIDDFAKRYLVPAAQDLAKQIDAKLKAGSDSKTE